MQESAEFCVAQFLLGFDGILHRGQVLDGLLTTPDSHHHIERLLVAALHRKPSRALGHGMKGQEIHDRG